MVWGQTASRVGNLHSDCQAGPKGRLQHPAEPCRTLQSTSSWTAVHPTARRRSKTKPPGCQKNLRRKKKQDGRL